MDKPKKLYLSKSAILSLWKAPHSYINNKIFGIQQPESEAMTRGKELHEVIENHCTGLKKDPRLSSIQLTFQEKEKKIFVPYNDEYSLFGFIDMLDYRSKTFCEIKTGKVWSQRDFDNAYEIEFYALALGFRKAFLITCSQDLSKIATRYRDIYEKDIEAVREWIDQSIIQIEMGYEELTRDLVDGKCTGNCWFRERCHFA